MDHLWSKDKPPRPLVYLRTNFINVKFNVLRLSLIHFDFIFVIKLNTKMDINLIDLMDLEDLDMLETSRRADRHRHRVNPFELSDEEFVYKYNRFTKRFGIKIVDLLREDLSQDPFIPVNKTYTARSQLI